jgi:HK97 family phage major capsid protein
MKVAHLLGSTMLVPFGAIFAMAADVDERLTALRAEVTALTDERDGIVAAADAAGEDLTDEQLGEVEELTGKIEAKGKQIAARERVTAGRASAGRRSAPEPTLDANGNRVVSSVAPRNLGARGGFKSFGEFAMAVRVGVKGANPDQRLLNVATTYGNEGNGADGGFAVPQEFRTSIWQKVMGEDSLITRTDQLVTGANNMTIPADETTPWQTTGGIQAYWENEGGVKTPSKPLLEMKTLRLSKLIALVPMSDELLEDAPGMDSYLRSKAPIKMQSKLNTAIVRGTGVGQPLGFLNSASLVTVSKESGPQTADTILFANIVKMWSRMYAPSRRNAIWLMNQDIEAQLYSMAFDPAATSKTPAFLPAGGLSSSPYATLMGRPVVPCEACSALGDLGDISLVDFSQYMTLTKGQDIKTDVSMHLYFDQDLTAYRFVFRVAGMPWWNTTLTPENGSATRSWAVTLEAR